MNILLETPRLLIREITDADVNGMFEMDSDPEVHKYINQRPILTLQQAQEQINAIRQQYADQGIGRWAVADKATGEFLGWTGFKFLAGPINGHSNYYDFGYRFARRHWGKGYATESGKASLQYGLETLKLKDVFAMTDVGHAVSQHILEILGFRYTGNFPYDEPMPNWRTPGQPTAWFELAR